MTLFNLNKYSRYTASTAIALFASILFGCSDKTLEPNATALAPQDEAATARTSLTFNTASGVNQMQITRNSSTGIYTIVTTGADPYISTNSFRPLSTPFPADQIILTFDYQCTDGIPNMQFFFAPALSEARSVRNVYLEASVGDEWKTFNFNIQPYKESFAWPEQWKNNYIRFDFGSRSDITIKIRNIAIRTMTEKEAQTYRETTSFAADKLALANHIDTYLNTSFSSSVEQVEVTNDEVIVRGITSGDGRFALAEVTPYENITEFETFPHTTAIRGTQFSIRLPRYIQRDGFNYDRLLSKWAIISLGDNRQSLASHARYADVVTPKRSPAEAVQKNKKGVLGCPIHAVDGVKDVEVMNYGLTANVLCIDQWLLHEPLVLTDYNQPYTRPAVPYTYNGQQYYINGYKIMEYDNLIKEYNRQGMIVIAYPEVRPPEKGYPNSRDPYISSLFVHPERNGGTQLMANTTSPEAINAYAAVVNFLADRYSQDGMRIHHWCIFNEVNASETWCNMGPSQPEMYFTDTYMKSLRLWYNIVRQYDQNASVLACFEHNWSVAQNNDAIYSAKSILENIKRYSAAEGDFWWGVAHHPYPYDLNVTRFWEYDGNFVNFTQDTPQITFYNLEVLNDWALMPQNMYHGTVKRKIYLTEQGVNNVDYSTTAMEEQAAGAAFAWKKVNALPAIDGIAWHANVDNTGDGNLRLGLHQYEENGYKRKPSWYVWKAAATADEDDVFAPYMTILGITSWDQIMH